MPRQPVLSTRPSDLRTQALSRLNGHNAPQGTRASASTALGVLHELASSPETAPKALALLHELQVHQVELDLQDEELRRSRAELEADLIRHTQLYDFAPVAFFTVERDGTVCELNLKAARLLGVERDAVAGQRLDPYFAPESRGALAAMLALVGEGETERARTLQLMAAGGAPQRVNACANADPAGRRVLLALNEVAPLPPSVQEPAGRTPS
jgi:PAS domain-containing protein